MLDFLWMTFYLFNFAFSFAIEMTFHLDEAKVEKVQRDLHVFESMSE